MYSAEERETIITTDDIDKKWCVYTRQKKIINKLSKLGYEMFDVELEDGNVVACWFVLDLGKITFRKAVTKYDIMSAEEKLERASRLKK